MTEDWRTRLRERMARLGYDAKGLSKKAGLGNTAVHDMLNKSRSPGIEAIQSVGNVLGMTLAELVDGENTPPMRVPIIGETSDSDRWSPYKIKKSIPDILDLPHPEEDLIAIRVIGSGMSPRYQKGDVLIGVRTVGKNADNYIGLPCIVTTEDGTTYVKVLTRGATGDSYTLRSYDPSVPDVPNVKLQWFARIVAIMPNAG